MVGGPMYNIYDVFLVDIEQAVLDTARIFYTGIVIPADHIPTKRKMPYDDSNCVFALIRVETYRDYTADWKHMIFCQHSDPPQYLIFRLSAF